MQFTRTKNTLFPILYSTVLSRTNLLLALYLLLVWFSASHAFQFRTIGVLESNFPGDLSLWQDNGVAANVRVEPDGVSIFPVVEKRTRLGKAYELSPVGGRERFIRIHAKVHSKVLSEFTLVDGQQRVIPDDQRQPSLLYTWFQDESQDWIKVILLDKLPQSDRTLKTIQVLAPPENATTFNAGLLLRQFQATHMLTELHISQVERSIAYRITLTLLVSVTIVGLCTAIWRLGKRLPMLPLSCAVIVAVVLVAGVLMPGDLLRTSLREVQELVPSLKTMLHSIQINNIQDILHFFGFLVLTVVVLFGCQTIEHGRIDALFKLVLFAVFTEALQRHSVERTPSLLDIIFDSLGVLVGSIIWLCLYLILLAWRRRSELV